jgi:hypothetical protein
MSSRGELNINRLAHTRRVKVLTRGDRALFAAKDVSRRVAIGREEATYCE